MLKLDDGFSDRGFFTKLRTPTGFHRLQEQEEVGLGLVLAVGFTIVFAILFWPLVVVAIVMAVL